SSGSTNGENAKKQLVLEPFVRWPGASECDPETLCTALSIFQRQKRAEFHNCAPLPWVQIFTAMDGQHYRQDKPIEATKVLQGSRRLHYKFFLVHFSWEYLLTVTRKKLYWDTLTLVLPVPLYRQCASAPSPSDVFKQLRRLPVPTSSKDFFVRFHVEVLPVKVWLDKKGFFVPWSLNCALCGATETLHHVFVECSNAYLFWAELKCLFNVDFEIDWNVFKFLCVESARHSPIVLRVLVVLGLHAIWRARTAMVERDVNARPTWWYFAKKARWTLSIAPGRFPDDKEHW
ncbi:unnamed protein product, partial [Ixodes hexagonus]